MIQFSEAGHIYKSVDGSNQKWLSVTSIVGSLKTKFNSEIQAPKSARNKKSKWYGLSVEEILTAWKNEKDRSVDLGHWYHTKVENELLGYDSIDGLKVHRSINENGIKMAPAQKLESGIYPEHLVYLESANICGQVDKVIIKNNKVNIEDHKTSKEIKIQGYINWEGVTTKMLSPVEHLDECEFNSYAIQLSLYMYIICRWNPLLQPGVMTINHVKLKEISQDKYGYPVYEIDNNGDYTIESIEPIVVPYLEREVKLILQHLKSTNRQ